MSDAIDRKVVLELALKIGKSTWKESAIRKWVNELPSAEKTGRWIEHCTCSECMWTNTDSDGHIIQTNYNYCPNCGERMISDTE